MTARLAVGGRGGYGRFGATLHAMAATIAVASLAIAGLVTSVLPVGAAAPPDSSSNARVQANAPASTNASITTSLSVRPGVICSVSTPNCLAGTTDGRVTVASAASGNGTATDWPAVQVVFLLETTPWDGVLDLAAPDNYSYPCAGPETWNYQWWPVCMESNAVPVFVARAGEIAENISSAHPNSNVTFALIDFFATHDQWDDGNGNVYHVDTSRFVPADHFGAAVRDTFQQEVLGGGWYLKGSQLHDDALQSSIITAMYGALTGQGLNWSKAAHHVIVWIGTTHPRDPSYLANECGGPTAWLPNKTAITSQEFHSSSCWGPTSEPAYHFSSGVTSPAGVGWMQGSNGSIAELARTGLCAQSLGGNCTIDVVVPQTMLTRDYGILYGPGIDYGVMWTTYTSLNNATCDIANATGGTWNAPNPFRCYLDAQPGDGTWTPHWYLGYFDTSVFAANNDYIDGRTGNNYTDPNTTGNPTLIKNLEAVGLGQPPAGDRLVARGIPGRPMFLFAPHGNFSILTSGPFDFTCSSQFGYTGACPSRPQFVPLPGNRTALAWNWSTDPVGNYLLANDSFTATFEVQATGPPYNTWVPVDACVTSWCLKQGSGPVDGLSSAVQYFSAVENTTANASFPLVQVLVETLSASSTPPSSTPPPAPPSSPTAAPPIGSPVANPVPVPQPGAVLALVGISVISIPAVTLGLIAMGFTRGMVTMRPARLAMPMAVGRGAARKGSRGPPSSAFDKPNDREPPFGIRFD